MDNIDATVDEVMREADLIRKTLYPQLDPQCTEATTTSPGRFIARIQPVSSLALERDRSRTKLMPGWSRVAAQLGGMPLDAIPHEKITTCLSPSTLTAAGLRASLAFRPHPPPGGPRRRANQVCLGALGFRSRVHGCRQHARVGAACGQARQILGMHAVVQRLRWREPLAPGDTRLQIDHSHIGRDVIKRWQGVSPRPGEVDRSRNPAVHRLHQCNVGARISDVSLLQCRITGMRKDLVDTAAGHHVATEKQCHRSTPHIFHCGTLQEKHQTGPARTR